MTQMLCYITAGSRNEAVSIGRALVADRLIACANVIDGMTAIYRWKGKVEEDGETVLIAKTTRDKLDAVTARVKELHSYECPCVVAFEAAGGNADFLNWIVEETS